MKLLPAGDQNQPRLHYFHLHVTPSSKISVATAGKMGRKMRATGHYNGAYCKRPKIAASPKGRLYWYVRERIPLQLEEVRKNAKKCRFSPQTYTLHELQWYTGNASLPCYSHPLVGLSLSDCTIRIIHCGTIFIWTSVFYSEFPHSAKTSSSPIFRQSSSR